MKHSLFRSIRHKLLNEGKLLRYLSYAVGEVILIIVGILMALKINDWNEDRKAQVEFDAYIVQLREDVITAIEDLHRVLEYIENVNSRQAKAVRLLNHTEGYATGEVEAIEDGISLLGVYNEPHVSIGVLGQLLDGNTDIISRDRKLSKLALELESSIEKDMATIRHIMNQTDLVSANIAGYRGRAVRREGIMIRYDLESLRASDEFINSAQTIIHQTRFIGLNVSSVSKHLEDFFTVLEEYE